MKAPPSALTLHETIPAGCFLHQITDDRCAPFLMPGQFAVIDPTAKEPIENELFMVQFSSWQSERHRSIVQLTRSPGLLGRSHDVDGWWEGRPRKPVNLAKVKTYRTMDKALANVIEGGLLNGPMELSGIRRRVVGRVVGWLLAPDMYVLPVDHAGVECRP